MAAMKESERKESVIKAAKMAWLKLSKWRRRSEISISKIVTKAIENEEKISNIENEIAKRNNEKHGMGKYGVSA
jgi:macrodomain Ter protein organizer (MatP/YcbG family)